jgi:ABC-type cobalamin/Fe3+-siderophores transport system ATPase subunit
VLQELREEEFMSCDLNALEHNEKQLSTIYSDVLQQPQEQLFDDPIEEAFKLLAKGS